MSWIDELKVGNKVIVNIDAGWNHPRGMYQNIVKRITPKNRIIVLGNDCSYRPNEAKAYFLEYNEENIAKFNAFKKYARVKNWIRNVEIKENNTALIDALYTVMEGEKSK